MICSLIRRHFSLKSLYAEPSAALLLRCVVEDSAKASPELIHKVDDNRYITTNRSRYRLWV